MCVRGPRPYCWRIVVRDSSSQVKIARRAGKIGNLPRSIGNHMIVAHAEQAFPAPDRERQNALQFVMLGFVCPVH